MSRRITTAPAAPQPAPAPQPPGVAQQAAAPAPAAPTKEDYLGRLLKYIPAELVGLYLAARGVVPESTSDYDKTLWVVAALTWILVPIYMYVVTTRGGQHALVWQIVLATVAFPVWVFATGGHPVVSIAWYAQHEFIGSLVLMFVTVIFGLKEP